MKHILIAAALATGLMACHNEDKKADPAGKLSEADLSKARTDSANFTTISFPDSTWIDMGKVKEGQQVEVSFRFKNTGSKPLIFTNVSPSCGCTTPEKPERPYAPGEEGMIKAKFDSRGRVGLAEKQIYVEANTKPETSTILKFKVEVTE